MKYTHDYSKLKKQKYTTIRRYQTKSNKKGGVVVERYPSGKHLARITGIEKETLHNLPLKFLQRDTDLDNRESIYALFQSFYGKEIDFKKEKFTIYHLEKLEGRKVV